MLSLPRLFDHIESNLFSYVKPDLWDDPFENFFLQQNFQIADGTEFTLKRFGDLTYGTCWTFNDNSDFAWRVYTSGHGAQIEVNIQELKNFFDTLIPDENLKAFQIGKITYEKWEKIKSDYESKTNLSPLELWGNFSLLTKRIEFKHEEEVRVLIKYGNPDPDRKIIKLPFDFNKLVSRILLDPRISDDEALGYSNIIKKLGYNGKVEKSLLYSIPKLKLKFMNIIDDTKKEP